MPTTASDARRDLAQLLRSLSAFPPTPEREIDDWIVHAVAAQAIKIERRAGGLAAPNLRSANSPIASLCRAARRALDDEERELLAAAIAGYWLPSRDCGKADAVAAAIIALRASAVLGLRQIARTGRLAGIAANDVVTLTMQRCVEPVAESIVVAPLGLEVLKHVEHWEAQQ